MCCIDVRSEGIRRQLESVGNYETFGFAGFFALPLRYTALGAEPVDLLPVLLSPTVDMEERAAAGQENAAQRRIAGEQVQAHGGHAFDQTRENGVAPFMLAEAGGFVAAPILAARTLGPARFARVRGRLSALVAPSAPTQVDADPDRTGMPDEEQALFAETALTTMGLTRGFAPLVVLCGHGSTHREQSACGLTRLRRLRGEPWCRQRTGRLCDPQPSAGASAARRARHRHPRFDALRGRRARHGHRHVFVLRPPPRAGTARRGAHATP